MGTCPGCAVDNHGSHNGAYPVTIGRKGALGAKSRMAPCECPCSRKAAPVQSLEPPRMFGGTVVVRDTFPLSNLRRLDSNPVRAMEKAYPSYSLSDAISLYDHGRFYADSPRYRANRVMDALYEYDHELDGEVFRCITTASRRSAWRELAIAIHDKSGEEDFDATQR